MCYSAAHALLMRQIQLSRRGIAAKHAPQCRGLIVDFLLDRRGLRGRIGAVLVGYAVACFEIGGELPHSPI